MNKSDKAIPTTEAKEPIAIVGMGCRFPGGADTPERYWRNLCDKVDAVREVPEDRWSIKDHYSDAPGAPGKSIAKWGGFLDDITGFEPEAFGISPREAHFMDPQQRVLLEVAWEAIEDAGCSVQAMAGSDTGVFVGVSTSDYGQLQTQGSTGEAVNPHVATGGALSIASNRISYCLNLKGPSVSVDTACSSSLIAVDLACRRIWQGGCAAALAGGVNIVISPSAFIAFSAATMLSPDGRCKAFDASANGFVRGEGAGLVMLKPLSRAEADGDRIYALILASGANQDGRTAGIAMPSEDSQAALIERCCAEAGVSAGQIDFMEAHGTGTGVGDPVEARALGRVLGREREDGIPCFLGSVKPNIGHLESAAGIAGLIKSALVLHHRAVPPHLIFTRPNPNIPFEEMGLRLPRELEALPERGRPALAAVNSFGFGGANAHAILSEPPREKATAETRQGPLVLPLSARTANALKAMAGHYRAAMTDGKLAQEALPDICHTSAVSRCDQDERLALVGENREELVALLAAFEEGEKRAAMAAGQRRQAGPVKLAFIFSGQGPQWWAMGRQLLEREPRFRGVIERCDAEMAKLGDWSLLRELTRDEASSRIQETRFAQPALFALQAGLYGLFEDWGIRPHAVMGHSVGEIAAAYASGALSLEEAARVAFHRGNTMDRASSKGRMLAVGLSEGEALAAIAGHEGAVALAAVNGPRSVTLSGQEEPLAAIAADLEAREVFNRRLAVNYAFHSPQMDPVEEALLESLSDMTARDGERLWVSSVTGEALSGREAVADYWWSNVRRTVCFERAFKRLLQEGCNTFLELSPHPVLSGSMLETLMEEGHQEAVIPSLRREQDEAVQLRRAFAQLWIAGQEVDWRALLPGGGRRVSLPGYPWQRQPYWHEAPDTRDKRLGTGGHPLLGRAKRTARPTWQQQLDCRIEPYLLDHKVNELVVFPGAGYLEMMLAVGQEMEQGDVTVLNEVRFRKVLHLPSAETGPRAEIAFDPSDRGIAIFSGTGERADWVQHASGYLGVETEAEAPRALDLASLGTDAWEVLEGDRLYRTFDKMGLRYGPTFRGLATLRYREEEALGEIRLPKDLEATNSRYCFHPALMDACFHTAAACIEGIGEGAFLPVFVQKVRFHGSPRGTLLTHARRRYASDQAAIVDLKIYSEAGDLLLAVDQLVLHKAGNDAQQEKDSLYYKVVWYDRPLLEGLPEASLPPVPDSERVLARLEDEDGLLARGPAGARSLAAYQEEVAVVFDELEELALGYVVAALRQLGLALDPEARFGREELAALPVAEDQRQLLMQFLATLVDFGTLSWDDAAGTWTVVATPQDRDLGALWKEGLHKHPSYFSELILLGRCGGNLAAILKGEVDPLQLLFIEGSMTLAEHHYQDSPTSYIYGRILRKMIQIYLESLPAGRPLRILEVGGGTGGLTSQILPVLPAHRCRYVFTDISRAFFSSVERKLTGYDFISFETLDIEADPTGQGFDAGSFDVVLASDVLHATKDLRQTLAHVRTLLRPDGLFGLIEAERRSPVVDVVFGPVKDWWRFADHALRPDYPLLSGTQWRALLEEMDFRHVGLLPEGCRPLQSALWAQAPGSDASAKTDRADESAAGREASGKWLVLSDASGLGEAVAEGLRARGALCFTASPGAAFSKVDGGHFTLRPADAEDHKLLAQAICADGQPLAGVVHLWSLDVADERESGPDAIERASTLGSLCLMNLVQAAEAQAAGSSSYRLLLVTRGAQPCLEDLSEGGLLQSQAIGFLRVLCNEMPGLSPKMLDLPPVAEPDPAESLLVLTELLSEDPEEEVAIRGSARFVPRIESAAGADRNVRALPSDQRYRLVSTRPGVLNRLAFLQEDRQPPGDGEVEIEVRAAALNFRDVLKALDLYPKDGPDISLFGDECAGVVSAVGPGVDSFAPGDAVVGFSPGLLASHVTLPVAAVVHKEPRHSFEAAVTMPTVFLTAILALDLIGRMRRDERLLIHSATGGVGLAALQVAESGGARIFTTAGNPEKRDFLALYGHPDAMDSRTLAFHRQIMARTEGRGVNLVLNALSGKAIAKGLACLAPNGRFLEIGKRDIYDDTSIGLWPFHKHISFCAIFLGDAATEVDPAHRMLVDDYVRRVREGTLHPLPHRVFPTSRVLEAFRYMSQAKHIGKVVLSFNDRDTKALYPSEREMRFAPDATYLITGGFGGVGLVLARWIVERGGRSLVLVGRRGAFDEATRAELRALRDSGAKIVEAKTDITDPLAVRTLLEEVRREGPPLKGIFHAAMVLDDCSVLQVTDERFRRVTAPKIDGAWNLHSASLADQLDYFVCFSSLSSMIGQQGQTNYVAANSFLDSFAFYRRAQGLPALTVNLGSISDVGFVSRTEKFAQLAETQGIPATRAIERLFTLTGQDVAQRGILRTDWHLFASTSARGKGLERLKDLAEEAKDQQDTEGAGEARKAVLRAPAKERPALVLSYLRSLLGRVIGISGDKIGETQGLNELGLDSLMAMEMRMRIERELAVSLPLAKLTQGLLTLELLTQVVMEQLGGDGAESAAAPRVAESATPKTAPDIARLVVLQAEGATPPLFCFHPAGGLVDVYEELAKGLAPDVKVIGVQTGPASAQKSVEEMAAAYEPLIRQEQPRGPYRLFGFSLGGFTAHAMAAKLESQSEKVAFLGIADSKLTADSEKRAIFLKNAIVEIAGELTRVYKFEVPFSGDRLDAEADDMAQAFFGLSDEEQMSRLVAWIMDHRPSEAGMTAESVQEFIGLIAASLRMAGSYRPGKVEAPIDSWMSTHSALGQVDTDWGLFTASGHRGRRLDAGHHELLRAPTVAEIAADVKARLTALALEPVS